MKAQNTSLFAPSVTCTIGLVRRFGRDAIRGTKTVLAVLAMLASVLAWALVPVRADDNDGDLGRDKVRVLTQNMYVGATLGDLTRAKTVPEITAAITALSQNILATKPAERAATMAAEIAKQRPDFVALHEAWKLTVGGVVKMDLLQSVIDELKARGEPYELAVNGTVNDEGIDFTPFGLNIQLQDRDAILMRTDVDILTIGGQPQQFTAPITLILSTGLPPPRDKITITLHAGYVSVDAIIRGRPLRFVSVHLVPNPSTILLHTQQLLENEVLDTTRPLVLGGDFNTTADDPSNPSYVIYQTLINAGLTDAWKLLHPNQPGFTCCQDADLLNARSKLSHRIDLILFRGLAGVDNMKVFGDLPSDRTPSGLWPSDHAGVVATLRGPESQQFIADK